MSAPLPTLPPNPPPPSHPLAGVPREMLTADGTRLKKKRGGNRKGSSNWKRREQNILLDLMQNAQLQWPTKLDDWNAMAIEFNHRIEAMGFTPRNGKSLRKKWQVLCSAKVPAEGEELTEQEKRAKAINARGPMGQGRLPADGTAAGGDEENHKRIKLDNGSGVSPGGSSSSSSGGAAGVSAGLASSPLAPTLLPLPPLPPLPLPLATTPDNAALIAEVHSLLASREKAREQQVAMFDEWRRRDEQERQQFDRLIQSLARSAQQNNNTQTQQTQPQQPQLSSQPPQPPLPPLPQVQQQTQQPQLQTSSNLNGGIKQGV